MKPTTVIVDLGYRGVDADIAPVQIVHRGTSKALANAQRAWLRRRQALEPAIGHLKAEHRMERCWLKGSERRAACNAVRSRVRHPLAAARLAPDQSWRSRCSTYCVSSGVRLPLDRARLKASLAPSLRPSAASEMPSPIHHTPC